MAKYLYYLSRCGKGKIKPEIPFHVEAFGD